MKADVPGHARPKHPGGRPTKRTPEILTIMADAISLGLTDEQAAALANVSADSLSRWQRQDPQFCVAIKKARAKRLLHRLKLIEAGVKNWTAIAWILERNYGTQFARPKTTARLEHDQTHGVSDASLKAAEEMLKLM